MKIDNFCSLGASLQTQTSENKEQPKIFYYRSSEDTIVEMLDDGYFDGLYRRVNVGDIILLYSTKGVSEYVFSKVTQNLNGIVKVEILGTSAESIVVDPEWSHLLPSPIEATNLKDYLGAIEDSLNTKQHQLTAGRSIVLTEDDEESTIAVDVDDELDDESQNPVSNEVITNKFSDVEDEIREVATKTFSFFGYIGITDPSTTSLTLRQGEMWINSATMPTTFPVASTDIKIWDGTAWENATEGYTANNFDTFRNVDDNEGYYWFGGQWTIISTDMSLDYFALNTTTGKWEIKDNVSLTGLRLTASPAPDATGHIVPDIQWLLDNYKTASLPVFASMRFPFKVDDTSWVNSEDYSWLYASTYVGAYEKLITQYQPEGKFEAGDTYYTITFSDGESKTTNVLVEGGTVSDLQAWATGEGYQTMGSTIEDMIVSKTLTPETETIGLTTITFYRTYDKKKIILPAEATNCDTIYSDTGIAEYFILDTTNSRFKLPRNKWGYYGTGSGELGDYIAESLPNITGTISSIRTTAMSVSTSGMFTQSSNPSGGYTWGINSSSEAPVKITASASNSSPTYQNDAPVQPRGSKGDLYFYVGAAGADVVAEIAGIKAETINNKADIDLANVSATGRARAIGWGMPDRSAAEQITLPFTPTKDGYILRNVINAGYIHITISGLMSYGGAGQQNNASFLDPISAGEPVVRDSSSGTWTIYFIPCKGE